MLTLLSPAKTLDFEKPPTIKRFTQPQYLSQSSELIQQLRKLSKPAIAQLMGISEKLSELNYERYQNWSAPFTPSNAKQAALAFQGDVYTGLRADTFSAEDFAFAQQHLRILSGLYGLLRPLDLMQAYRLEMGTRFDNDRGKNLYQFWGSELTSGLNKQLRKTDSDTLINLSSNEYYKAVKPKELNAAIVTPIFKEWKQGDYKLISFFAKKARGTMAAYIVKNRITDATDLNDFKEDGYRYNKKLSTPEKPAFTRKQA